MRLPALVVLALATAGCAAPGAEEAPEPMAPTALLAGAAVRIDEAQPAREPSIVRTEGGTLFVAGYWGHTRWRERLPASPGDAASPLVWTSADDGATWARVPVGAPFEGAIGNSDVQLLVDGKGVVYLAALWFAPGAANMIVVGASEDEGATWRYAAPLAVGPFVDRPWLRAAPDGTIHAVWNDPQGIHHAKSSDSARTFEPAPDVTDSGGDGGFDVGPGGELVVRVVPLRGNGLIPSAGPDALAVSSDGGATWRLRDLPGTRPWASLPGSPSPDGVPRAWDPVAIDGGGVVHVAWAEPEKLFRATSRDLGATWDVTALAEGGPQPFFPFLRGGARAGEVAVSWFGLDGSGRVPAYVARVDANGALFAVLDEDTGSDDHGEYFELAWLPDGSIAAAVPVREGGGQWLDYRVARAGESPAVL